MINFCRGDILNADAEALVNTVNCVGVMGRGIALQFKSMFPENFAAYARACDLGDVQPGRMFVYETSELTNPRYIINFPTKRHDRLDILAWNPAVAELFVDYGALEPRARNTLHLMFLYAPYRELIDDWERVARSPIGMFRAARAKTSDKALFDELIEEMNAGSEEFRDWWQEHDVQAFGEGVKRLNHPARGRIDLTYVALTPEGRPDLSLVSYLPSTGEGD